MIKIFRNTVLIFLLFSNGLTALSQSGSWYKCFTGTIGKYPITLHLNKLNDQFTGYYYYNSAQQPIYFTGRYSSAREGKIRVYPYIPDKENSNEILDLVITGKTCKGYWKKNEAATSLPVSATEKPSPAVSFEMIFVTDSGKLRPSMPETPTVLFEAGTIWPRQS